MVKWRQAVRGWCFFMTLAAMANVRDYVEAPTFASISESHT
jgi:hypothetical protein